MLALPSYPCTRDMWDRIKEDTRPIVVYGMGNGADKLFDRLKRLGVAVSDIFASDGFVRGHSFRGMRVKSLSEIRGEYPDFLILLSFASSRREVLDMLYALNDECDMLVPDMPVADTTEYFTKEFYNDNYESICKAYNTLKDEHSREIFASILHYKLTGELKYLKSAISTRDELYSVIGDGVRSVLDVGAYNGDTFLEALEYFPRLQSATLVEPDPKTFRRLTKTVDAYLASGGKIEVRCVLGAAWCGTDGASFSSSGNRNSTLVATPSFEHKSADTQLLTIDSLDCSPDYIKYDVEGAEYEALVGSDKTIQEYHPTLLVSLYHRSRDIFSLINYISDRYDGYEYHLCRLECLPAWEIDLVALPVAEK